MSDYFEDREKSPITGIVGSKVCDVSLNHPRIVSFLESRKIILPENIQHERYVVRRDLHSRCLYQTRILTEEFSNKLYNDWISPEYSRQLDIKNQIDDPLRYATSIGLLVAMAGETAKKDFKILDFGAGWGAWANQAQALGYNVVVSELSIERVSYLEKKGLYVIKENFMDSDLSEYQFDYIHAEQVFEHLSNPMAVLLKLRSLLAEKGVIYLSVPNATAVYKYKKFDVKGASLKDLKLLSPLNHINGFTPYALSMLAKKCGMEVIKFRPAIVSGRGRKMVRNMINWIFYPYLNKTVVVLRKISSFPNENSY